VLLVRQVVDDRPVDEREAFRCELDEAPAAIGRIGEPLDETGALESVQALGHPPDKSMTAP
jgi:hypothetical protein